MRTHYDNLKVARNAPSEVIKAAYKALTQKYHPDKNPGDSDAHRIMSLINASYEVLIDPEKRRVHDLWILGGGTGAVPNEKHKQETPPAPPVAKRGPSVFNGVGSNYFKSLHLKSGLLAIIVVSISLGSLIIFNDYKIKPDKATRNPEAIQTPLEEMATPVELNSVPDRAPVVNEIKRKLPQKDLHLQIIGKDKWNKIDGSMSLRQVDKILGPAFSVVDKGGGEEIHYYSKNQSIGPFIRFVNGKIFSWGGDLKFLGP